MTITINPRSILLVLVGLLVLAGVAFGAYSYGRSTRDEAAARARGFRQGEARGQREALQDAVKQQDQDAPSEARSRQVDYLGFFDWKDDAWYAVHVIKRTGDLNVRIASVNDRQLMSPGLTYSLCGDDKGSICWSQP